MVNNRMKRRDFFKNLALGGATASIIKPTGQLLAASASKPNVLILYADDLGWGDLSINNSDKSYYRYTPNINRILTQGIRLDNYVTHCVCTPSRAGLLTAKHYTKVMAGPRTDGEIPYGDQDMTFGKDFQKNNYKTGCFGKWHNSDPNLPEGNTGKLVSNDEQKIPDNSVYEYTKEEYFGVGVNEYGFDKWAGYYSGGSDLFTRVPHWIIYPQASWWVDKKYMGAVKGYTTDLITDSALKFIEANKNNPFLCYVSHQAVHNPTQVKRSELKEFCDKLDTESGIPGQWDYVKEIKSPKTGRKIKDAKEIKCYRNEEFDMFKLDPKKTHFNHLIFGCYLYSLDLSVGKIINQIKSLGLFNKTIFLFASDNGGLPQGCSLPFKGGKHTIWEGGVHVPAALWWPGTFDAKTPPYTSSDNSYKGHIGYCDIYPTLMSMTGHRITATDIDGQDCWNHIKNKTEARPEYQNPYYEMWREQGSVRTTKWKLIYSEAAKRIELYDIQNDIDESDNVAAENPIVRDTLIAKYLKWLKDNKLAVPYVKIPRSDIAHPDPEPSEEVLEIKAWQNSHPNRGLNIRFGAGQWGRNLGHYTEPGDRVEYDIFVCEDSEKTSKFYYSPAEGWNPVVRHNNGINQDGILLRRLKMEKGKWSRQVMGVGTTCPGPSIINYVVLFGYGTGYYHFYLDNVVVRKNNGKIRTVIWKSGSDTTPLLYQYKFKIYNSFSEVKALERFPFDDVQISTLNLKK